MTCNSESQNDLLNQLILELDHTHRPEVFNSSEFWKSFGFPNFSTAKSGQERHFTERSRQLMGRLTHALHAGPGPLGEQISEASLGKLLRQVVTDLHASQAFVTDKPLSLLRNQLLVELEVRAQAKRHYLPARTLGVETLRPWSIGPVVFLTWSQWVDAVDFPDWAKAHYPGEPGENGRWKEIVRSVLEEGGREPGAGIAGVVLRVMRSAPAVLAVTLSGLDEDLSRQRAEIACKTALDASSLLIALPGAFFQQALQSERLPPLEVQDFIESEGLLWSPRREHTERLTKLSSAKVSSYFNSAREELDAIGSVLDGLVNPASHPHPQLASRWATALDWYAEAQRERSDAIAVVKLGTSLDVLSGGGKFAGILTLAKHMLKRSDDAVITTGVVTLTLRALVKRIYDERRSQILHGTLHDRMIEFQRDRHLATQLVNEVLRQALMRLYNYRGPDTDPKAFQAMAPG